ncbi:hypothetical protein BGZ63DRAFT_364813, partial [Mariannaea sp. PMI_226]
LADLPWYRWWLYQQIRSQPQRLLLALPNMNCDKKSDWDTHFLPLCNKVRELVLVSEPKTIDSITDKLVELGIVSVKDNYEAYYYRKKLFNNTKVIISKALNAHVLTRICGVRLEWVDSLSCHLELDRHSGTLFLYQYPSFCVSSLKRRDGQGLRKCAIHRCGFESPGSVPWASEEDVTELVQEILLSYRLLFGHSRRKRFNCPITLIEREEYDLAGDFPHLRSRIVRLNNYASSKKPRAIRQLWRDKRDSTAWLAFRSVLSFRSVSILLGVVQTVFQIMQYVLVLRQGGV